MIKDFSTKFKVLPKKITFIGGGYVGLVSAVCFAKMGHSVSIVETNFAKAEKIRSGIAPFFEKDLQESLTELVLTNKFKVFSELSLAFGEHPDFVFLCVGTPSKEDGSADLSQVWSAVDSFCQSIQRDCIFVCKSTVPVGLSRQIMNKINGEMSQKSGSLKIGFAFVPEFLREGSAISDFFGSDRIVVGLDDVRVEEEIKLLHAPILERGAQFFSMNFESAELVKLTSNAMLALRVGLINQVSNLAEIFGADIDRISQAVGADHRIGPHFLQASPGFGGSCLPKDLASLVQICRQAGCSASIVQAVLDANFEQRKIALNRILKKFGPVVDIKIGIFGLAFKSGTDDLRSSPALWLAVELTRLGAQVLAFDRHVRQAQLDELAKLMGEQIYSKIALTRDIDQFLAQEFLVVVHKTDFLETTQHNALIKEKNENIFLL